MRRRHPHPFLSERSLQAQAWPHQTGKPSNPAANRLWSSGGWCPPHMSGRRCWAKSWKPRFMCHNKIRALAGKFFKSFCIVWWFAKSMSLMNSWWGITLASTALGLGLLPGLWLIFIPMPSGWVQRPASLLQRQEYVHCLDRHQTIKLGLHQS